MPGPRFASIECLKSRLGQRPIDLPLGHARVDRRFWYQRPGLPSKYAATHSRAQDFFSDFMGKWLNRFNSHKTAQVIENYPRISQRRGGMIDKVFLRHLLAYHACNTPPLSIDSSLHLASILKAHIMEPARTSVSARRHYANTKPANTTVAPHHAPGHMHNVVLLCYTAWEEPMDYKSVRNWKETGETQLICHTVFWVAVSASSVPSRWSMGSNYLRVRLRV